MTEAEIIFGLANKPGATQLARRIQEVLPRFTVLPWTTDTARAYATLRVHCERRGIGVAVMDLLIASHALEHQLNLITKDRALLQLSDSLAVEDWA